MYKHLVFLASLCLSHFVILGQDNLPWELERFDSKVYESANSNPALISDETELFQAYYLEYKQKRTKNPAAYFSAPSLHQQLIKENLSKSDNPSDLLFLIYFLEKGSLELLEKLAEAPYEHSATLPYRFIAEIAGENKAKAEIYLQKMDDYGMISPVLKAWGLNAISNPNQQIFMTHGMQDLVGLYWALSESKRIQNAIVFNRYVNNISHTFPSETAFLDQFSSAWISPVFNLEFLNEELHRIRLSGIGFKRTKAPGDALSEFENAAMGFAGIGTACKTPADVGLVESYRYFNRLMKQVIRKNKMEEFQALQADLDTYIEHTTSKR